MSEVLAEWVRKALADRRTAHRELEAQDDPNYDAACYHAQQCVEKLLKAWLTFLGTTPPRLHDLVALWHLVPIELRPNAIQTDELAVLSHAAVAFRYPGEFANRDDAYEAVSLCDAVSAALLQQLGW